MRIAKLKLIAGLVVTSGFIALASVGTVNALARSGNPPVAPTIQATLPRDVAAQADPPIKGDWLPKKDARGKEANVPTAFPDLKPPDPRKEKDFPKSLKKLCPLILGDDPPAIVPTDDTARRLLKARLHQGRVELMRNWEVVASGHWNPDYMSELFQCLKDMRTVTLELWGNDPKVLTPWLEEFVIMGKMVEDFLRLRVEDGNEPSLSIHTGQRHRLEAEAALWKAKKRE
jgi:hypothetical protein